MRATYAAASGALAGALIGIIICALRGISLEDTVFRVFVLAASGAWMGMLLAWLNHMLTPPVPEIKPEDEQ
ncbi:MAG: hypothetical protein R8K49_06865 [Mariprofundaceae bacterium]